MNKPNILFIVIDALRPENLGCYGYRKSNSPNIDRLGADGLLFKDAYSCTNATDPSLTAIFSGKFCRSHGIMKHGALLQSEEVQNFIKTTHTLPEILKRNGYQNSAVDWLGRWHVRGYDYYSGILRPASRWERKRLMYGQSRGDEAEERRFRPFKLPYLLASKSLRLMKQPKITTRTDVYGDAAKVTQKALEIIKQNLERNFFLFLHYWDTHFPYNRPASSDRVHLVPNPDTEEQLSRIRHSIIRKRIQILGGIEKVLDLYDGAIAFVDQEIGKLVEALEQWGILDNTMIILTADHGESLTEHEIYFDHHGLYQETIHVPLILRYPRLPRGKVVQGFVQHPDITPTILDILDIKSGPEYDGRSLLPLIYDNKQLRSVIYAEETHSEKKQMIATYKYKYIRALSKEDALCKFCQTIHGGIEELYDLAEDPEETRNVIEKYPDEVEKLRMSLAEWIGNTESKRERIKLKGRITLLKRDKKI